MQTQGYNKEANTQTNIEVSITLDEIRDYNFYVYLYSHLLLGSSELPNNPLFFGELDKDNSIKQDTPSYHFSPKDKEYNLGTLTLFLNSYTLTLLNYSLLDSTLNIKLTLTHKESKEKQDKATMQREQKQHKEQTKALSTSFLHIGEKFEKGKIFINNIHMGEYFNKENKKVI